MPFQRRNLTAEAYLAGALLISLIAAAILSRVPGLAFGGFIQMTAILVSADVLLYILMKLGVFGGKKKGTAS